MVAAGRTLSFGPDHRASEAELVPHYKPEAPQAAHQIKTKLGQLVALEEKYNSDARYEDKVLDLWSLMGGYVALLRGKTPPVSPKEREQFDKDLAECEVHIAEIAKATSLVPDLPHVDVKTGNPDLPVYQMWFTDKTRTIDVLDREYQFTFKEAVTAERERAFRAMHQAAFPGWVEIQGFAARWGIFGPETRVYNVEIANSLDRTLAAIGERRALIRRRRLEAVAPPPPVDPEEPST